MNDDIFPVPEAPAIPRSTVYQMGANFTLIVFEEALKRWLDLAESLYTKYKEGYKPEHWQNNRKICGLPAGPPTGRDIEYLDFFTSLQKAAAYVLTVMQRKTKGTDFYSEVLPQNDTSYGTALHSACDGLQGKINELGRIWQKNKSYFANPSEEEKELMEMQAALPKKIYNREKR